MNYKDAMLQAGRAYVTEALIEARGKVEVAAMQAGVHRTYFYRLMEKYGVIVQQRNEVVKKG